MRTNEQKTEYLAESIKDFFIVYSCGRSEDLARLADFADWSALAQREVENRAFAMMTNLPTAELMAIASGAVDVPAILRKHMEKSQ